MEKHYACMLVYIAYHVDRTFFLYCGRILSFILFILFNVQCFIFLQFSNSVI